MSPRPPRDDRLGAALSEPPRPRPRPDVLGRPRPPPPRRDTVQQTESGELHQPPRATRDPPSRPYRLPAGLLGRSASTTGGPAGPPAAGGRMGRSLGAAAAAVALVVAAAGASPSSGTTTATGSAPPTGPPATHRTPPTAPGAPAEFSATYDGIEGFDGPDGCCSKWRLTFARDGSFRWTSTDGSADMAYDATTGRHVDVVTRGAGVSPRPARTPSSPPASRPAGPTSASPSPTRSHPIADFVVALARAGDPRITTTTVAGRAAWHYDGPTVQDRLGGEGAPNHAVADVDQASGVLLELTRRVDDLVVTRFTASDVADQRPDRPVPLPARRRRPEPRRHRSRSASSPAPRRGRGRPPLRPARPEPGPGRVHADWQLRGRRPRRPLAHRSGGHEPAGQAGRRHDVAPRAPAGSRSRCGPAGASSGTTRSAPRAWCPTPSPSASSWPAVRRSRARGRRRPDPSRTCGASPAISWSPSPATCPGPTRTGRRQRCGPTAAEP